MQCSVPLLHRTTAASSKGRSIAPCNLPIVTFTTFTDPDDYRVKVPGASINLVQTGPGDFNACLTSVNVRGLCLVRCEETAPRVALSPWPPDRSLFRSTPPIWNGVKMRPGEFPAAEAVDIPISSEAQRFYKSGPPLLHDYFPFWMTALIGKLIILMIPILGVLYPMMRSLPRLYHWLMRSKILRMYGELRLLEGEMANAHGSRHTSEMIARLDRLEEEANHTRVPVTYASMLYGLRDHIDLVREALKKHAAE